MAVSDYKLAPTTWLIAGLWTLAIALIGAIRRDDFVVSIATADASSASPYVAPVPVPVTDPLPAEDPPVLASEMPPERRSPVVRANITKHPVIDGPLGSELAERTLMSARPRLRKCKLSEATLRVSVTVEPNGSISELTPAYLDDDDARCVRAALRGLQFPRATDSSWHTVTYEFDTQGGDPTPEEAASEPAGPEVLELDPYAPENLE